MKIKFNNETEFHTLSSYGMSQHEFATFGIPENLSGFVLYEDDEVTEIEDYSGFIYRHNPYDDVNTWGIIYTDDPDNIKPAPDPNAKVVVFEDPVSQEELTEAVADLMVEVDIIKLGL